MKNRLPMFTSVAAVVVFLIAVTFVTVGEMMRRLPVSVIDHPVASDV